MKSGLGRVLLGAALLLVFASAPARAEWRRAESPHFVVYSEESEPDLRERILLLENFRLLLRTMTTAAPGAASDEQKLHIYVVKRDDLRVARPVDLDVAGFYTATPDGIAAFVARDALDGNEVLFHEYTHHFMLQFAPNAYPSWYIEGFAEYFMTARLRPGQIEMGRVSDERSRQLAAGEWLPMSEVLLFNHGAIDSGAFYAESWAAVHYFFSTDERRAALTRYLAAVARGDDPHAAFEATTGMSPARFDAELRSYLRRGSVPTTIIRHAIPAPPPITVTVMPRSANDLMLYEATLRIGVPDAYCNDQLHHVRAVAPRFAGDPTVRRLLAQYEIRCGDAAAADRLLDGLLAETPNEAELLYLRGMRHLRAARDDRSAAEMGLARQWFGRAHAANQSHYPTLYRYAESLRGGPDYISENTENLLVLALQIAPQVDEIRLETAMMLMQRGEFGDAENILKPLVASVHSGQRAQRARDLIERARRHVPPEEPATPPPTTQPAAGGRPPAGH